MWSFHEPLVPPSMSMIVKLRLMTGAEKVKVTVWVTVPLSVVASMVDRMIPVRPFWVPAGSICKVRVVADPATAPDVVMVILPTVAVSVDVCRLVRGRVAQSSVSARACVVSPWMRTRTNPKRRPRRRSAGRHASPGFIPPPNNKDSPRRAALAQQRASSRLTTPWQSPPRHGVSAAHSPPMSWQDISTHPALTESWTVAKVRVF